MEIFRDLIRMENNKPVVLVIGDLMIDRYIYGKVTKISPEAPVPVFEIHSTRDVAGGAANVATNLVALGAQVILAGYGTVEMKQVLGHSDIVRREFIVDPPSKRNNIKLRYIDSTYQQQMIRIDNEHLSLQDKQPYDIANMLEQFADGSLVLDAIIFSDYNKKTLNCDNIQPLIEEARERGILTIADTRRVKDPWIFSGIDYITPNLKEFLAIEESGFRPERGILRTESEAGMKFCIFERKNMQGEPDPEVRPRICAEMGLSAIFNEVVDVTGAGDTVTAAFAYFLCRGMQDKEAFMLSNIAAGLVCKKHGTASVTLEEIGEYAKKDDKYQTVWNRFAIQNPNVCANS